MKCFVAFLMTLAVVNSFPLKNDEDSSLKRKVMAVIQELSVSNGSVYDTFFNWSLVIDLGFPWCLFLTLSYGSKQQALHIFFCFSCVCFFFTFFM